MDFPYFSKTPYNALNITKEDSLELAQSYFFYNIGVAGWNDRVLQTPGITIEAQDTLLRPFIRFKPGKAALVIEDESLVDATVVMPDFRVYTIPKFRHIEPGEIISGRFTKEDMDNGFGSKEPIPSDFIITKKEIAKIIERIDQYNEVIGEVVEDNEINLIDMHSLF